ncbi:MAG: isopentenyl phosphate kinase [Candidatus Micrarchaeales archaeon]
MQKELIFIKLGGSTITDINNPFMHKSFAIKKILRQIKKATEKRDINVVIGHGGGSFGHEAAKINDIQNDLRKGVALTHAAMVDLNHIILDLMLQEGFAPFPFHPSNFMFSRGGKIAGVWQQSISAALANNRTPVVHGDIIMDFEKNIYLASTEAVFNALARDMRPSKIILLTDVDGVFDSNPKNNKNAKLVPLIDGSNISKILKGAGPATKTDYTGGMNSKVQIGYETVRDYDATVYIANGTRAGIIEKILNGDDALCTIIRK